MSDFLTNLVMRSFAQTPSVQPVTLSTYAAPEPPQIDSDPIEHVIEPVQFRNRNQRELAMKEAPLAETRPSPPEHFEENPKTEAVQKTNERKLVIEEAPSIETLPSPPEQFEKNPELHHQEVTHRSAVQPLSVMSKPDQTIAPAAQPLQQRIVKPSGQVQKVAEPLIVEQMIEHVVERPTVKSIERPTVRTIERPTITTVEQSTIETIDRPSVTSIERSSIERSSIERSIEQSSITIENTEHVTNSFTRLVPKVTPQSLPARNLKSRGIAPPPEIPIEEQQQTTTASPETVINVAIGRIEVRATPAPAPGRERAQGPKVMTLDDYVQQRSRGAQ